MFTACFLISCGGGSSSPENDAPQSIDEDVNTNEVRDQIDREIVNEESLNPLAGEILDFAKTQFDPAMHIDVSTGERKCIEFSKNTLDDLKNSGLGFVNSSLADIQEGPCPDKTFFTYRCNYYPLKGVDAIFFGTLNNEFSTDGKASCSELSGIYTEGEEMIDFRLSQNGGEKTIAADLMPYQAPYYVELSTNWVCQEFELDGAENVAEVGLVLKGSCPGENYKSVCNYSNWDSTGRPARKYFSGEVTANLFGSNFWKLDTLYCEESGGLWAEL